MARSSKAASMIRRRSAWDISSLAPVVSGGGLGFHAFSVNGEERREGFARPAWRNGGQSYGPGRNSKEIMMLRPFSRVWRCLRSPYRPMPAQGDEAPRRRSKSPTSGPWR